MGQYWKVLNLDRKEFVHAHDMGCGLKLCEQIASHPSPATAMFILCAAMPEPRGGGDFDLDVNWHGPERKDYTAAGPMPEHYPAIAARTIGRWAGDRIAVIGDYAETGDIKREKRKGDLTEPEMYAACTAEDDEESVGPRWVNVTEDVKRVIEHELRGAFVPTDWGSVKWQEG